MHSVSKNESRKSVADLELGIYIGCVVEKLNQHAVNSLLQLIGVLSCDLVHTLPL